MTPKKLLLAGLTAGLVSAAGLAVRAQTSSEQGSNPSGPANPSGNPSGQANPSGPSNPSGSTDQGTTSTQTIEKNTSIPPEEQRKVNITVKSVDKENHTVLLEAKVTPEAQILEDGKPIKIDKLEPGDEVHASFDPKTGDMLKLEVVRKK
jgi:hypothetical protein